VPSIALSDFPNPILWAIGVLLVMYVITVVAERATLGVLRISHAWQTKDYHVLETGVGSMLRRRHDRGSDSVTVVSRENDSASSTAADDP
jgi:hypothetical protein